MAKRRRPTREELLKRSFQPSGLVNIKIPKTNVENKDLIRREPIKIAPPQLGGGAEVFQEKPAETKKTVQPQMPTGAGITTAQTQQPTQPVLDQPTETTENVLGRIGGTEEAKRIADLGQEEFLKEDISFLKGLLP